MKHVYWMAGGGISTGSLAALSGSVTLPEGCLECTILRTDGCCGTDDDGDMSLNGSSLHDDGQMSVKRSLGEVSLIHGLSRRDHVSG